MDWVSQTVSWTLHSGRCTPWEQNILQGDIFCLGKEQDSSQKFWVEGGSWLFLMECQMMLKRFSSVFAFSSSYWDTPNLRDILGISTLNFASMWVCLHLPRNLLLFDAARMWDKPPQTHHTHLLEISQAGISLDYGQKWHSRVCICSACAYTIYHSTCWGWYMADAESKTVLQKAPQNNHDSAAAEQVPKYRPPACSCGECKCSL